ncbi:oligopeptide transporter [Mollisia scopiformis]|uniref:Oligopeptide transporter n=1 Tax=Mollisia scopiformis TaxID=149040 RepID=A0A194X9B0_MOLSC|nr:oligopeptide transporter [Mollisia scopiformis]KUJ16756.1 oligopeptide transporter [Mollisia scopiformis]
MSAGERHSLRRVPGRIPLAIWLISISTLLERFAYYSFIGPLQNYIQNSFHDPLRPGALGMGQSIASILNNAFLALSYITPMFAAVISDEHLGRFRTICWSMSIYITGVLILTITSIPALLEKGAGLPGLIVALLVISVGTSGVKAALPPFLADNCGTDAEELKVTKNGEKVVIDRDATREYAFNIYYWCVNVGALSRIPSTFMEKDIGFWSTYSMSTIFLCLSLLVFMSGFRLYVYAEREKNAIRPACSALVIAGKNGFRMEAARPEEVRARDGGVVDWDNKFITDLKTGLIACRTFLPIIVLTVCQNQLSTNTVSQAANMQTHGIPNDVLPNVNSITVVILMPLITHILYPLLRRFRIKFPPITRMALGFAFEVPAMAFAAGVQGWIYDSPPCYSAPRKCAASNNGLLPNAVNVAAQVPIYVLEGFSEAFAFPAMYEYAYTKAPKSMKAVVQAILSLAFAFAALLGIALSPTYHDPELLAMYASLAGAMCLTTILFYVFFRKYNAQEDSLNAGVNDD